MREVKNKMDNKRDHEWIEMSIYVVLLIVLGIKKGFNYPVAYGIIVCIVIALLDIYDIIFSFSDVVYKRIKIVRKILKISFWIGAGFSMFFGYDSMLIEW